MGQGEVTESRSVIVVSEMIVDLHLWQVKERGLQKTWGSKKMEILIPYQTVSKEEQVEVTAGTFLVLSNVKAVWWPLLLPSHEFLFFWVFAQRPLGCIDRPAKQGVDCCCYRQSVTFNSFSISCLKRKYPTERVFSGQEGKTFREGKRSCSNNMSCLLVAFSLPLSVFTGFDNWVSCGF